MNNATVSCVTESDEFTTHVCQHCGESDEYTVANFSFCKACVTELQQSPSDCSERVH